MATETQRVVLLPVDASDLCERAFHCELAIKNIFDTTYYKLNLFILQEHSFDGLKESTYFLVCCSLICVSAFACHAISMHWK